MWGCQPISSTPCWLDDLFGPNEALIYDGERFPQKVVISKKDTSAGKKSACVCVKWG